MNDDADKQLLLPSVFVGNAQQDLVGVFSGVPGGLLASGDDSVVLETNPGGGDAGEYRLAIRRRTGVTVPELWTVQKRAVEMLADFGRIYSREHLQVLLSVLAAYRLSYDKVVGAGVVCAAWLWVPECLALLGQPDTLARRKAWLKRLENLSAIRLGIYDKGREMQWHQLITYVCRSPGRGREYEAVQVVPSELLAHVGGNWHWPLDMAAVCSGDSGLALSLWLQCASQWRAAARCKNELVAHFDLPKLRQRLGVVGQLRGPSAKPMAHAFRLAEIARSARARAVAVSVGVGAVDRAAFVDAAVNAAVRGFVDAPVDSQSDLRAGQQLDAALNTLKACGEALRWEVTGGALGQFRAGSVLRVWCARSLEDATGPGAIQLPVNGLMLRDWMGRNDIPTAVSLATAVGVNVAVVRRALTKPTLLIPYDLRVAIRHRFCPGFPGD